MLILEKEDDIRGWGVGVAVRGTSSLKTDGCSRPVS